MQLLSRTADPDFDIEELEKHTSAQPLLCLTVYFANYYQLVQSLELDLSVLQRFTTEVESAYRPLPYHSALHAADVVANAMRLMRHSEYPISLTPLELLAVVISCAGE